MLSRPRPSQEPIRGEIDTAPFGTGAMNQVLPLVALGKYEGVYRSVPRTPPRPGISPRARRLVAERQASILPFTPENDRIGVRGHIAKAFSAGRGHFGTALERLESGEITFREAQRNVALDVATRQGNQATAASREALHAFRDERFGADLEARRARLDGARQAFIAMTDQALPEVERQHGRSAFCRALEASCGTKGALDLAMAAEAPDASFDGLRERAEPMLREQAAAPLQIEAIRAGEIRASAGIEVARQGLANLQKTTLEPATERYAQSLSTFLADPAVEKRLAVLYSGLVRDPLETDKLFGPEGREMRAQAADGRVPTTCLNEDGTIRWAEARHWLGIPSRDTVMRPEEEALASHWERLVEDLNQAQRNGDHLDLNPGFAAVRAIEDCQTLSPQQRITAVAHGRVREASEHFFEAQRALVQASGDSADEATGPSDPEWVARVATAKESLTARGEFDTIQGFEATREEYDRAMAREWTDALGAAANARVLAITLEGGQTLDADQAERVEQATAYAIAHPELRAWAESQTAGEIGARFHRGLQGHESWAVGLNEHDAITPEALRELALGSLTPDQSEALCHAIRIPGTRTEIGSERAQVLLAAVQDQASLAAELNQARATIQTLDLTRLQDRVKLWRALDYDFAERLKAGREDLASWTDKACVTLKAAWVNQTMGNIRSGTRIGFHTVLGGSKAVYQLGASGVGAAQALVQAIMALQRAQEVGGSQNQADILGAATQVWEGGLGLGRAGAAPVSGVVQAGSVAAATGRKLTDIPHETREKMARLMRFEEMGKGLRDQEAQTASQDAKEAAEAAYNYTTEFRRAADKAREFAIATDPRERERWRTELEASRMLMEGHMATITAHYPEIAEVLTANEAYSLEALSEVLDEIERMVPERYRNVFGNPLPLGIEVPTMLDREGRTVPGLGHGDGAPVIDLGQTLSGAVLGAVVDEGKIRFSRITIGNEITGEGTETQEIGEVQVGRWAALEHSWQSMTASGRSPAREYPPEYSAELKQKTEIAPSKGEAKEAEREFAERRQEWDTFAKLKALGLTRDQSAGAEILDRFGHRLGGNLKQFTCTLPDHRAFQESFNEAIRRGDQRALGLMNTPESETRLKMVQVDKTLKLMERRTPMELIAFYNAMMLDRHGDRVAEWEDAIAANDQEFGW